jgi:hypothetical protein
MTKIIEVKGYSVVAREVLKSASWKKVDYIDENYPCREFFKKGDDFCKIAHPIWNLKNGANAVRLEKLN